MNIWWTPGQSDAAKEICRDLNRGEKAGLASLNVLFGLCIFTIPIVLMGSTMGIGPFQLPIEGFVFPLVGCLAVGAWIIIALQRRLLLGTQVAKDNGLTIADINARQPLSRRDYIFLGGTVALVVTIALAASLASFLMAA